MPATIKKMLEKEEVTFTFKMPKFIKSAGMKGATGLLAAAVFDIIHPISGAIFASSQSVMQQLLAPGVKELLTDGDNLPSRVYLYVITFLSSAVVSISMTLALGFPMNFPAAIWLSVFMIPASLAIEYIFKNVVSSKEAK